MESWTICTNPNTGEKYRADVKLSWGHRYYSIDGGKTWFRNARLARESSAEHYAAAVASAERIEARRMASGEVGRKLRTSAPGRARLMLMLWRPGK